MCFTCLRSGLSSFASIKIFFFSLKPFFAAFIWRRFSQFLSPRSVPFKVRSFSFEVSGLAVVLRLGVRGVSLHLVLHCLGKCGSSVWPPDFPIP